MSGADRVNEFCHYATAGELAYLRTLATALPAGGQVVMLGAGPGVMMLAVLEGNPALLGTIIDHDTCVWARKHLTAAGLDDQVSFVVADSADAGAAWALDDVDLLIVDADHSHEGVSRDLQAWLPHVVPGGYVFCHDYDAEGTEFAGGETYPGVRRGVDERLRPSPDYLCLAEPGTAVVFRKSGRHA